MAAPVPLHVERAIEALLRSLGRDPGKERELRGTAKRVARALCNDVLDGYRRDPAKVLGKLVPHGGRSLVSVRGIRFHSVCPHHLLPYRGTIDLVYRPTRRVAGFAGLVRLVDYWAHRLILQEEITAGVAGSLVKHLGAIGAACRAEAEHSCMIVRGPKRDGASVVSFHVVGDLTRREALLALGARR